MAYRELTMIEIRELLRRLCDGQSMRQIARETGLDRKTVRRYREAADTTGLSPGQELTDERVHEVARLVQERPMPPPSEQREELTEHREQIDKWLGGDSPLRLTKVNRLLERKGVLVHYSTLRRFAIDELDWRKKKTTVRIDDPPAGEEAQADFGRMAMMVDPETGRRRKLWALIVTLSFSRHMFVWPTFEQTIEAVCEGLDAAWRFFDGIVTYVIVDNLKPVIAKADPLSPKITEAFTDYAQARNLFVDAARVRHPKDKPRVENQVPYVREDCFAGEELRDLAHARELALDWCLTIAGTRTHGTTRRVPLSVFEIEERPHLKPAPTEPFDVPVYADAKVHPDHHIVFGKALYSLPTRYIGKDVRVRGDRSTVRVYLRTELIKTHPRKPPGGRSTDKNDYPKDKADLAFRNVDNLIERAYERGESIGTFASRLLEGPLPWTKMRQAYALLRLCDRYTSARVEAVCRRALYFDVIDTRRVERMLKTAVVREKDAAQRGKLVQLPLPEARFARTPQSFETRGRDDNDEGGAR